MLDVKAPREDQVPPNRPPDSKATSASASSAPSAGTVSARRDGELAADIRKRPRSATSSASTLAADMTERGVRRTAPGDGGASPGRGKGWGRIRALELLDGAISQVEVTDPEFTTDLRFVRDEISRRSRGGVR